MSMQKNETGKSRKPLSKKTKAAAVPEALTQGRRQKRAEETRLKLFRTALQLFAERGFANVTVGDITEAADVGKGTFFNYFPTKDHVLQVMTEIQLSKLHVALERAKYSSKSVYEILHEAVLRLAEEPGRSPDMARALLAAFLGSELVRDLIQRQMAAGRGLMAELIELGQKSGEIEPGLNRKTLALQLQQSILGSILLWSLDGEPTLKKRIEESFQYFWRAAARGK